MSSDWGQKPHYALRRITSSGPEEIKVYSLDQYRHLTDPVHLNRRSFMRLLGIGAASGAAVALYNAAVEASPAAAPQSWKWATDDGSVNALAFTLDGKMLASAGDRAVKFWKLPDGDPLVSGEGHTRVVNDLAFSADGSQIISGSDDQTLILFDASTGQALQTFTGTEAIRCVAISPDGKMVASGSANKNVVLWEVGSGNILQTFSSLGSFIYDVAFDADGQNLLVNAGTSLFRFDSSTGEQRIKTSGPANASGTRTALSADGKNALSAATDSNSLIFWDINSSSVLGKSHDLGQSFTNVVISPDGKFGACRTQNGDILILDLTTTSMDTKIISNGGAISSLAFSPDAAFLAVGDHDGGIVLWQLSDLAAYTAPVIVASPTAVRPTQSPVTTGDNGVCTVTPIRAGGANLRSGPGTDFDLVGSLASGDSASVTGQAVGTDNIVWWRLSNNRWVRSDVVSESKSCASVPVVAAPAPPQPTSAPPPPQQPPPYQPPPSYGGGQYCTCDQICICIPVYR